MTHWIFRTLGGLHVLIVHLPIGMFFSFLLLLVTKKIRMGDRQYLFAVQSLFVLAIATCLLGYVHANATGEIGIYLDLHFWLAIAFSAALGMLSFLARRGADTKLKKRLTYCLLAIATCTLIGTGHFGGVLVYGENFLTKHIPYLKRGQDWDSFDASQHLNSDNISHAEHVSRIFSAKCTECHNESKLKSGLDLSTLAAAYRGGKSGPALVPGHPEQSLLYKLISSSPAHDRKMPPVRSNFELSDSEIQLIKRWIAQGADHQLVHDQRSKDWAYVKFKKPTIEAGETINPIDYFWQKKLAAHKLRSAEPLSPTDLIRRVYFDMWGLAPEPGAWEELADNFDETKYQDLVDYLLADRRYGEHWAKHWLDRVRFAESASYQRDLDRWGAYNYRNYVVTAINDDISFKEFVQDQIAGDTISPGTWEGLSATGFLTSASFMETLPKAEHYYDQWDDMLATTFQSFLGITVGCARCHDHKFEKVTQKQYYQLLEAFRSGKREIKSVDGKVVFAYTRRDKFDQGSVLEGGRVSSPLEKVSFRTLPAFGRSEPEDECKPSSKKDLRAQLADWLIDTEDGPGLHLARTVVNYVWSHHFEQGIVPSTINLGVSGSQPSHPDLLNWLAYYFMETGWSLKKLQKLILTSNVYRQGYQVSPESSKKDPNNKLIWRQNPTRLDAEMIRDVLLQAAGHLNDDYLGASVRPPMAESVLKGGTAVRWPFFATDSHEQNRRSLYIFRKRSMVPPVMQIFDFPMSGSVSDKRRDSTTPLQALFFINSEFVRDRAIGIAERLLLNDPDPRSIVKNLYSLLFTRKPSEEEIHQGVTFIANNHSSQDPVVRNVYDYSVLFEKTIETSKSFVHNGSVNMDQIDRLYFLVEKPTGQFDDREDIFPVGWVDPVLVSPKNEQLSMSQLNIDYYRHLAEYNLGIDYGIVTDNVPSGTALSIAGKTYQHGLGTVGGSVIAFDLGKDNYVRLEFGFGALENYPGHRPSPPLTFKVVGRKLVDRDEPREKLPGLISYVHGLLASAEFLHYP